jgi:benzoyl-CoA reductase/2-hydroxyglutaryl-CoA dehydratase subunit BcrC/BadD/HgdB
MENIGITTTVPIEVLLAAGWKPVDLNNILVADRDPGRLIAIAERAGFPMNCCAWIKGIYGVCLDSGIEDVLCVTGGDCSNTLMLMETLRLKGLNTIPFAFPARPDPVAMQSALETLAASLGTTLEKAGAVRGQLQPGRELARRLDEMTWRENKASGWENHLWLVSASDFNRELKEYENELTALLESCAGRPAFPDGETRLAYIGVPAVYARELYPFIERNGGRVVFNEVQRQFAMPEPGNSLAEQYSNYTYPYSIQARLRDIRAEARRRRVEGVIHYVQAFCHRGIGDIIFRQELGLPVLTLEGNADFFLNAHNRTRVEAFLDMLQGRRKASNTKHEIRNKFEYKNIEKGAGGRISYLIF